MFPIDVLGTKANSTSVPFYNIGNPVPEGVIRNHVPNVVKGNTGANLDPDFAWLNLQTVSERLSQ